MVINKPYLLFLGDASDQLAAKTAEGVAYWRRSDCVGQMRLPGCNADLHLPDLTIAEAAELGAITLLIGVANRGGLLSEHMDAAFKGSLGNRHGYRQWFAQPACRRP